MYVYTIYHQRPYPYKAFISTFAVVHLVYVYICYFHFFFFIWTEIVLPALTKDYVYINAYQ